jgi:hypothetical protein
VLRIDLHTHSEGSYDGGLSLNDYLKILNSKLDIVAITDHNHIKTALSFQAKIGVSKIIVGEEITTAEGELIGLYLNRAIEPHKSALETARAIKQQGGLVYVPHPFERLQRFSLDKTTITKIARFIDIFETYNARSMTLLGRYRSKQWAKRFGWAQATASDAHGPKGLGSCATLIPSKPTSTNLVKLLQDSRSQTNFTPLRAYLEPRKFKRRKQ